MSIPFLKKVLMIFLFVNVLACKALTPGPKAGAAEIEQEEQAVYSVVIHSGDGPAVLLRETSADISSNDPTQSLDYIKSGLHSASKATLKSFVDRNRNPSQLSPDMHLDVDYVLLSADEQQSIFTQADGWDTFYEKYPGSGGYTSLSRVGFNDTLDQAVVYVGNMAGPLMGAGFYYLLEKKNGEWQVIEQVMAWIS